LNTDHPFPPQRDATELLPDPDDDMDVDRHDCWASLLGFGRDGNQDFLKWKFYFLFDFSMIHCFW
jgi:hypothetical protein